MTLILGIESTAHTFGVSVVSSEPPHILSDSRRIYSPRQGGILPREVAPFFSNVAGEVVREALDEAGVGIRDVDAIAVALGPGMGPQLRVGASVARALASYYGKPLVPVNHAVAHVEIARFLTGLRDPIVLYVAGGNTTVVSYSEGRYRVFGETLDIPLGNLQDTFAREAGIGPPYVVEGKHVIDICSEGGEFIEGMPYIVKGQDSSFSGLLTAALRLLKKGSRLQDVCFTLREIAYSSVVEVLERGLAHTGKREVLLTGGVAASKLLNEKIEVMAKLHGALFKPIPGKYSGDNGVMIALTGLPAYLWGYTVEPSKALIRQRWRIDQVDIPWYYEFPR
ncbi:MAG: KEOPS complex N(6)-L-threonylcarbamoyladenine synthase Kae1 [Thermoprotei archaeon]|nr:KEOPS complex N(6)-L-threonylcarbamoyladenine synthase Kae1 [Thermoprotei archaeon]